MQPLPEASSEYDRWRFSVKASILAAAPDPILALVYLTELDDPIYSMDDLARGLAVEMTKTDVRLFAAVVGACKGIDGSKTVSKIQSQARFGCGRQALRVIDTIFRHEAEHLAVKATAQIANLECRDMNGLENYLTTSKSGTTWGPTATP